jgi:hypothetical protein
VRNAADGKATWLGSHEARTPPGDVAKRDRNPKEGAGGDITAGGHETEDSEEERSSRGDETASASERRTASGGYR